MSATDYFFIGVCIFAASGFLYIYLKLVLGKPPDGDGL